MPTPIIETRALLIDDHRINADLVASMLAEEPGLLLDYLQDPVAAVQAAVAFAPTVIMVDLHMPLVDGLEVIRALKSDPRVAAVPIIMLSSNSSPQVKADGFAAGAMDYLVKWPDRIELVARLRAHSHAYCAMRERDQATEALRASQAALFERTRELADAQAALHEAEKMEALAQLTSGVAHDFNNVLQLINGHLQLLRIAHRTDEKTLRRLDAASDGVRRGAQIASQMLAFAHRQALKPVPILVGPYLRSIEPLLRRTLGGRTFTMSADTGLAASLDPAQFQKTILHLVQNAAEATGPDGRIHIEVDTALLPGEDPATAEPGHVRIALRDNGVGMSDELLRRVVEPFFSTKTGVRRSGLGLSLAFGFVRQSGGQLDLASTPGEGTTAALYFPRLPLRAANAGTAGGSSNGACTVLVVEDEAAVRQASVEVLRKLGLCVLEAADGESALALIRQRLPIDLVFTDIVMPGAVQGRDLALASAEHLPRAKILFASGFPGKRLDDDDIVRCTPLLRKPYRFEDMTRMAQALLEQDR